MRVIIVTPDLPPDGGGIGKYTDLLARGLVESGDSVLVVKGDFGKSTDDRNPAYEVVHAKKGRLVGARMLLNSTMLAGLARERKCDAIICTNWNTLGAEALLLRRTTGIPYFVVVHAMELVTGGSDLRDRFRKCMMMKVLLGSSGIIAVSRFTKKLLVDLGLEEEKVEVVHNGIDLEAARMSAGAQRPGTRGKGVKTILTVSRIERYKGIDRFIRLVPEIERRAGRVVYVVVGDGPFRSELERIVEDSGLSDRVILAGRVSDERLVEYYRRADLFVLPTIEEWDAATGKLISAEGFGLVLAEASSFGIPVVASRSGGTVEVVEDGVTGFLVEPEDDERMVRTVTSVLLDPALSTRLGEAGRKKAFEQFDYRNMIIRIRGIIEETLRRNEACAEYAGYTR